MTIDEAFTKVRREDFLPEELRDKAPFDMPLPIGYGATNSQPSTVRQMLEWLDPEPGNKVLDVGSGSGWTTALLANVVGPKGKVYAVEAVPALVEFGRQNNERAGITNAQFFPATPEFGLHKYAPYDRILVSAEAAELPRTLVDQLKPGGTLIIPVSGTIMEVAKLRDGKIEITPHYGYAFVPLININDEDYGTSV